MSRDIDHLLQKDVGWPRGILGQFQGRENHFAETKKLNIERTTIGRLNGRDNHEFFMPDGPESAAMTAPAETVQTGPENSCVERHGSCRPTT
jgi:hypothetical protein